MPGPALYAVAILGGVAVGFAFKEFVFDPHIAPKLEEWRAEFQEHRRMQRRQAHAMSTGRSSPEPSNEDVELRSRSSPSRGPLRRRRNAGTSVDDGAGLNPASSIMPGPTHVISSGSVSGTPTVASSNVSRSQSPSPSVGALRSPTRTSTLFDADSPPLSPYSPGSPVLHGHTATESRSFSQLFDHSEHDGELMEAPPSPLSAAGSDELFMSFSSPQMTMSDAFGGASPRMSSIGSDSDAPRIQSPNFEVISPRLSSPNEGDVRSPFSDFSDISAEENGSEMSWTSARYV